MRWHVVERLSPRQAFTPDGYLIVTDTIIARCGDQTYHRDEVPLDADDDGMITVSRDASEVFRPEAIASFEGKPITDDHPDTEVTPENHRDLAVGHVQHVRRGTGADADCLVADLVFTDPRVIDKVRGRKKLALSCGYDAHYEHVSKGRGAQRRIVGNHVALVDEGRCGARCTIGDSGGAIFSYLAAKKVHDKGCGCDVCDRQQSPHRARRLVLWVDGVRVWSRRLRTRDFDPSEPRKGTGPGGGEWTSGGGGGGKTSAEPPSSTGHGATSETSASERRGVPSASAEGVSAVYRRGTSGDPGRPGGRGDNAPVRASFRSSDPNAAIPVFDELGAGSGATFAQHITESKTQSKFGAAVAVYPVEEYNQMRLFTTPDGKAGFALHGDDIISVYRKNDGPKGAVGSLLNMAVQEGGRRLDCFDTVLPAFYSQSGFKAVARLKFNDEYKPDGWDYERFGKFNAGRPDVVFMTYAPGSPAYRQGDGKVVEDYDQGTAAQHAALGGRTTDAFDPNEPRDETGEWTAGGGSGGGGTVKSETFNKTNPVSTLPLNGKPLKSWPDPPQSNDEWDDLANSAPAFDEPPLPPLTAGKHQGAGVIIREPDGRVWIVHPTNQYGGYKATFPKGTVEPGMTLKGTAVKEAFEESGLGVKLTGYAGDIERDTSVSRYYYAERVAGTPADAGWESQAVTLSPVSELKNHLNKKVDHDIVDLIIGKKPAPAEPTTTGAPTDISKWKKTSGNLGSNPGGQYTDEKGDLHYVKLQKSNDHAKNEFLAARLFEAAGSPILNTQLVDLGGGKLGTETMWKDKTNIDLNDPAHLKMAQENFATNAWLANWDAIGMGQHENDWNQAIVDGKMTTVDPGGSMIFRAQGGPKGDAWGDSVGEWDTMRHGNNPQANKAYGGMTGRQLRDSVLKVVKIPDKTITDLTAQHGPGDFTARQALAKRLIARKRDLMQRAMGTQDAMRRAA